MTPQENEPRRIESNPRCPKCRRLYDSEKRLERLRHEHGFCVTCPESEAERRRRRLFDERIAARRKEMGFS
jgi:hypothetical protein